MSNTPKSQRVVGITSLTYAEKVQQTPAVAGVTKFSGARFPSVGLPFPSRGAESGFSRSAPFRGPTPQIASPRRDLAIRAAEGEIAEGLQQNDAKVTADRV